MAENAIVILTWRPHTPQIEFYKRIIAYGYDIFVIVDDNVYSCPDIAGVKFLQIDDRLCMSAGFKSLNPVITEKKRSKVSSWEKAIYYFCFPSREYSHIWFIEDDVFVPAPETIPEIDSMFSTADIVSAGNNINFTGELESWVWWKFVPKDLLPLPWASSMVCAIRLSRAARAEVNLFINQSRTIMKYLEVNLTKRILNRVYRTIFKGQKNFFRPQYLFIEYFFHTLALHRKLHVVVAPQLKFITWNDPFPIDKYEISCIYHPVKDLALQDKLRAQQEEATFPILMA